MTTYLTTLAFDSDFLTELEAAVPGVTVRQIITTDAADIPAELWAQVEVLHTSSVFPSAEQAPHLRWIQLDTSGAEHVPPLDGWRHHIDVTSLGGIAPVPMAEFTVLQLLGLAHHRPLLDRIVADRAWPSDAERLARLTPLPVDGATATIVGYGRIGREIARLLSALGVCVIGLSRSGRPGAGVDERFNTGRPFDEAASVELLPIDRLAEALPRTDYLIVVVPRTSETIGLIGPAQLAALPRGACLIDVSRTGVVQETAVLDALANGQLRYAALDVFEEEPLAPDSPLWRTPGLVVTPHVAGLAPRYREQVLQLVSTNLARYVAGAPLLNRVDRVAGY